MNTLDSYIEEFYVHEMTDVDLNLMRTLALLCETRSVTRTAEKLYVTQPSVSYALGRLRRQFNDELFVRSSDGLRPTALAEQMYPSLRQALEVIDETVSGASEYDPATSERTFRILATDLGEISLLPIVLAKLETSAPRCGVEINPLDSSSAAQQLRQGSADAAICTPRIDAPDLRRDALFLESYVGLCRKDHHRIGDRPTLTEFLAERHIVVFASAGHSDADAVLTRIGESRDVAVRVPHFAVLPELLASTHYLSVVPGRVADLFTRSSHVRTFPLPFEIPTVEVALYTYRRAIPSPGIEWLRSAVTAALH
ncbi:MAG: LysR family transcriptional regulator [Mycobacteriaceae bacterium]